MLLIDGFNLLSRGYFATSYNRPIDKLERNDEGQVINGLRVFLQKLFKLIRQHNITHCAVTWDVPREESIRRLEYPPYKQTRGELPEPLIEQFIHLQQILTTIGIPQLTMSPYEADDIIGTITANWEKEMDGPCLMYSNDRDLLQLVSDQTHQIISKKKEELIYSKASFEEEFGIHPYQWVDVKALLGDPSDNIPGCLGIGEKTALPLISAYGSVDSLYKQIDQLSPLFQRAYKKLIAGQAQVELSKRLATIIRDIPDICECSNLKLSLNRQHVENELTRISIRVPFEDFHAFVS